MSIYGQILEVQRPRKFTALTPSDSTDITSQANVGLFVVATGTVVIMGVDDTTSTSLGTQVAGTFVSGRFQRLMSASSATVVGAAC